jgi:hypothetical protein
MASLQHPVPAKLLVHIGDITVSFALLESTLQVLIGSLINEHQRIGQIIAAELPFKGLRALAISLYKERHGEDGDFEVLRDLMKRCAEKEGIRNQITHSLWAVGGAVDTITRIKTTAKEKHGVHFHFEQVSDKDLENVALAIRTLAFEIHSFWRRLVEHDKAVNNPLQKLW